MRQGIVCALMTSLLLTGCGAEDTKQQAEAAQAALTALEACTVQARVICELEGEMLEYELSCAYDPAGVCRVTVLSPMELAGIGAELDGERLSVVYDDLCLPAGLQSSQVSAADCLPRFLDALRTGYLSEYGQERLEETDCLRLRMETADGLGQLAYTVWLNRESWALESGEIEENGRMVARLEFTEETSCVIMTGKQS